MAQPANPPSIAQKVSGDDYEFALGKKRLRQIVNEQFSKITFDIDSSQYEALSDGDKKALYHLVQATYILDDVFLDQDHPENKNVQSFLERKAEEGDERAQQTLTMFKVFNGLEGMDMYATKSKPLNLIKGKKLAAGKGFYPQDMTMQKLRKYLLDHPEQAGAVLSNNTMVRAGITAEGDGLVAEPYSVAFRDEMNRAARELLSASRATDHAGLAEYLSLQAQALVNDSDPEIVYRAEKSWIGLEDSPLEFTIARECYADHLSAEVANDPKIKQMLAENGIKAKTKDTLGVRCGIVNQDSLKILQNYRNALDDFTSEFPLYNKYAGDKSDTAVPMTFADVDLVAVSGDYKAFRGGITIAQNLPNDDKLSVQLRAGSRLVFHRSVRQSGDPAEIQRELDALLEDDQHALYDKDILFEFTIGHEMAHSLGPKETLDGRDKKTALGKWGSVIEENKADMGSLVMAEYMTEQGYLTRESVDKMYVTWAMKELPVKQPGSDEAHRFRSIMQLNYFREHGAMTLEKGGKLRVDVQAVPNIARQMLEEIVEIQLEGDSQKADTFASKYGAWNEALDHVVSVKSSLPSRRYKKVEQPFADKLLNEMPKDKPSPANVP